MRIFCKYVIIQCFPGSYYNKIIGFHLVIFYVFSYLSCYINNENSFHAVNSTYIRFFFKWQNNFALLFFDISTTSYYTRKTVFKLCFKILKYWVDNLEKASTTKKYRMCKLSYLEKLNQTITWVVAGFLLNWRKLYINH